MQLTSVLNCWTMDTEKMTLMAIVLDGNMISSAIYLLQRFYPLLPILQFGNNSVYNRIGDRKRWSVRRKRPGSWAKVKRESDEIKGVQGEASSRSWKYELQRNENIHFQTHPLPHPLPLSCWNFNERQALSLDGARLNQPLLLVLLAAISGSSVLIQLTWHSNKDIKTSLPFASAEECLGS